MINPLKYQRVKTHIVKVGDVEIGGENPIRLQSMTNTLTSNIEATVNQTITIYEAGGELVRITAPTVKDAELFSEIKEKLNEKGYKIPLIADIHFSPKAAEISAQIIEKVRVNPGNYTDSKHFKHIDFTEEEFNSEIQKIEEKFVPLLKICKENNTAIRIGANHGSLSDRIISKYGDTPRGMVESTMEFLEICKKQNFTNIVISMKASNPVVMISATRLLVKEMHAKNMYFPLHLGVTEAGSDDEGRIKSAVGIGTLLADGIGDTIRVSLTEEPEVEIPVAQQIIDVFNEEKISKFQLKQNIKTSHNFHDNYTKRKSLKVKNIGANNAPVVIADFSDLEQFTFVNYKSAGFDFSNNTLQKTDLSADYIFLPKNFNKNDVFPEINYIIDAEIWKKTHSNSSNIFPVFSLNNFLVSEKKSENINFVELNLENLFNVDIQKLKSEENIIFVANVSKSKSPVHELRAIFYYLEENNISNPVILKKNYSDSEKMLVSASAELGALFIDGFGDGIWIESASSKKEKVNSVSFGILQACRVRITRTEYISCPSCGRTLFNLQKTTAEIKERTSHLKGVKIGIMGCIVNGPGEMADADFGYVGAGSGKVNLYKNQDVIKRNIPEENAIDELLKLIESERK